MVIEITADDLRRGEAFYIQKDAKDESGGRIWHVWKNPISIAVERTLGRNALCTVTPPSSTSSIKSPGYISLASRLGGSQRLELPGDLCVFMEEWKRAIAQPLTFEVAFVSSGF